jgi:hypothetical protein
LAFQILHPGKKNYKKQRKKMKISKETNELSRGKKGEYS